MSIDQIPCHDCGDLAFTEETSRALVKRVKEHQRNGRAVNAMGLGARGRLETVGRNQGLRRGTKLLQTECPGSYLDQKDQKGTSKS